MMREIDIEEASGSLPQLVDAMAAGDEVVLTRGGRGVAKLSVIPKSRRIRLGVAEGKFTVPDDFDAPLPDDLIDLFYDGPLFPDEPLKDATESGTAEPLRDARP